MTSRPGRKRLEADCEDLRSELCDAQEARHDAERLLSETQAQLVQLSGHMDSERATRQHVEERLRPHHNQISHVAVSPRALCPCCALHQSMLFASCCLFTLAFLSLCLSGSPWVSLCHSVSLRFSPSPPSPVSFRFSLCRCSPACWPAGRPCQFVHVRIFWVSGRAEIKQLSTIQSFSVLSCSGSLCQ